MHAETKGNRKRQTLLICLVIACAVAAVYWQVKDFSFVSFDDPLYVKDNPMVRHGLTLEGLKWAFTVYASNWHPRRWGNGQICPGPGYLSSTEPLNRGQAKEMLDHCIISSGNGDIRLVEGKETDDYYEVDIVFMDGSLKVVLQVNNKM